MAVITISRQRGSGGDEIARKVCQALNYQFFEKRLMLQVAKEIGLLEREVVDFSENTYKVKSLLERLLKTQGPVFNLSVVTGVENWDKERDEVKEVGIWTEDTSGSWNRMAEKLGQDQSASFVSTLIVTAYEKDNMLIVGRGGQAVLQQKENVLHVRIIAPAAQRARYLQEHEQFSPDQAKKEIETRDRAAREYLKRFHGIDGDDSALYHLVINTGKWEHETAVRIILNAVKELSPTNSLDEVH